MSSSEEDSDEDIGPYLGEYEGERNEFEERHGKGKTKLPNGDTYEGEYAHGKRQGQGIYKFKHGGKYVGGYMDGKRHGEGIMYYPDGSKYDGSWSNNARNGYGTYYYINGDIYEGDWIDNKKDGQGIYTYADTGSKFQCRWIGGLLQGPGEFINQNHRFVGNFEQGHPKGTGRFLFDNGCEQLGEFVIDEEVKEPEVEEDNQIVIKTSRWIAESTRSLDKVDTVIEN
eukprot:gene8010-8870_t